MLLSGSAGGAPMVKMPYGFGAPQLTSLVCRRKATTKLGKASAVPSHVSSRAVQAVPKACDPEQEERSNGAWSV